MWKIVLSATLAIGSIQAQFLEDAARYASRGSGLSARALGMGNASIGVSDDYSASLSNPAGLAQMRRLEFVGGISNVGTADDATYLGNKSSESVTSTGVGNLGFVFPFPTVQGSLVFAFGYNRMADYSRLVRASGYNGQSSIISTLYQNDATYDIPFNIFLTNTAGYTSVLNNVQQSITMKEGGSTGLWSFSGAIDVEENISFGISLNVISGTYDYTRNYLEEDINNVYNNAQANLPRDSAYLRFNKFYYDNYLSSQISGAGLTFGMMWRSENLRLGLVVKSPTSLTIKETYSDAGQSLFDNVGTWQSNSAPTTRYSYDATNEYGVSSAWTFGAGGSYYILPQILLAADIEYTDWTQVEWTDNTALEKDNPYIQSKFRATTSYRIGTEIDVPGTDVRVRGGYSLTPSPYKNDPTSFDQVLYTGGVGIFLQRNVALDGALSYGTYKSFRNQYSVAGLPNTARTDESLSATTVNVTLSYRF